MCVCVLSEYSQNRWRFVELHRTDVASINRLPRSRGKSRVSFTFNILYAVCCFFFRCAPHANRPRPIHCYVSLMLYMDWMPHRFGRSGAVLCLRCEWREVNYWPFHLRRNRLQFWMLMGIDNTKKKITPREYFVCVVEGNSWVDICYNLCPFGEGQSRSLFIFHKTICRYIFYNIKVGNLLYRKRLRPITEFCVFVIKNTTVHILTYIHFIPSDGGDTHTQHACTRFIAS